MKNKVLMANNFIAPKALYFCIFCQFFLSMGMWIGWDGRNVIFQVLLFLIAFFLINTGRIKLKKDKRNLLTWFAFSIASIWFSYTHVGRILSLILPSYIVILLNDDDKIRCFQFIFKWFAIMMIPSIMAWIVYSLAGLPSFGQIWVSQEGEQPLSYLLRNNHIFLISYVLKETPRFMGYFIEPGHLGMMGSFLLFADGYNFQKKISWIILLSLLLSFSLTGFILLFLGYLFVKYEKKEIRLKFVILLGILILFVYLFAILYNGGDNILNEKIIARMEFDEENGIVGNNRVLGEIDLYFATMFNNWHLVLFGYDREIITYLASTGSRGTGMQYFMVCHGLAGVFFSFFPYLVYYMFTKNKQYAILSLVFILLLLLQRSYWYWLAWIICYIYGITLREKLKLEKQD